MIKDKITSDKHSALAANILKTWSDEINYPTDQDWALSSSGLIIKMYLWLQKGILYCKKTFFSWMRKSMKNTGCEKEGLQKYHSSG